MRDFGKNFVWGLTKSETQAGVLVFMSNNSVSFTKERWTQQLSGILLNYSSSYYFNWTFFGLRSGPLDFFGARV